VSESICTCMVTTRSSTTSSRVKKSAPTDRERGLSAEVHPLSDLIGSVDPFDLVRTDSSFVLIGEPLVHILVHQGCLSDPEQQREK
jgi:hypothetical protein